MDEIKNEEDWDYQERRSEARKKISLKKTFPVEIQLETTHRAYVYVSDISFGGMKIITDQNLPDHRTFTLKILSEDPLEVAVQVVWQKKLVGYMNSLGLKYVRLTPRVESIIEHFISQNAIDTSKRIFRLDKMLNVQILREGKWVTFYAYILNMNPQGFEFTTDFGLPANEEFPIRGFIIPGENPIEADARILFQKDISMGRTKGWLEFVKIDERNRLRLVEHIDRLLQGELPVKFSAEISDFEIPEFEVSKKKGQKAGKDLQKIAEDTVEAENGDSEWIP